MPKYTYDTGKYSFSADRAKARIQQGLANTGYDPYHAIDGDTIDIGRIEGIDALESSAGLDMNTKAKKLQEQYGISIADQKRIGLQGKTALETHIKSNPNIEFETVDYDVYGRPILRNADVSEAMVRTGLFAPTNRYDEKLQSIYRATQEKNKASNPQLADALEAQRAYNIDPQEPSMLKRVGEAVDAFQSGTQQALAGTADFVLDVVTPGDNTLLNKMKSSEYANEIWGYDDKESNFKKKEALHNFKNEKYVSAVVGMATSPELWGESLPMIAEMAVGAGKFTALGKLMKIGTQGLKGAERVAEAKRIKDGATAMEKATLLGAENVGFLGVVGDQTNRHVEEFTTNNNGVPPSMSQIAGMTAMNVLQLGLDRMAFGQLISTKGGIQVLKDTVAPMLKVIPDNALGTIAKKVATTATGITAAMGTEAAQEYLQTWAEMLNTKAATTKYGDWLAVLQNPEAQDEAIIGMLAGAGMGAQMRAPAEVLGGSNEILNKLAEVTTGKTVADVTAKKIVKDDIAKQVFDRRVELSEDMNEIDTETASLINEALDSIRDMDTKSPDYVETVNKVLKDVDSMRADMNIQPIVEETVQPTPADVASKVSKGETLSDMDLQVQANEGAAIETELQNLQQQTEEAPQYDEKTTERMRAAGISNILTKEDREANINIEMIRQEGDVRPTNVSKKKQATLDAATMDDVFIDEVMDKGVKVENLSTKMETSNPNINLVQRLAKKLGYGEKQHREVQKVYATVKENMSNEKAMSNLSKLAGVNGLTPASVLRMVSLASSAIESATGSEVHIANKADMEAVDAARVAGLDVQIGKEYMNSFGLKVAGGSTAIARKYAQMGRAILEYMKETKMVEMGEDSMPVHNMKVAKGKQLTSVFKEGKRKGTVLIPTVKLVRGKEINPETGVAYSSEAIHTFSKLFKPSNYQLPSTEASTDVVYNEINPIGNKRKDILKRYQELKYHVKPEMITLLKEIRDEIRAAGWSTDKALTMPKYKALLGLHEKSAAIQKLRTAGRSINKKKTMTDMLDNIDEIEQLSKEGFNYSYETAINDRIHVLETVLEFQGDKYMARQMVTQGGYTVDTSDKNSYKLLIDDIADNLPTRIKKILKANKIDPKDYIEGTKTSILLDDAMKTIAENKGKGFTLTQLGHFQSKLKFGSSFKAMSVLQAIYDVRNAKDGKITTEYMVESDATASGITNTMFNLSGMPLVQGVLKAMGISKNGYEKGTDPYMLLVNAFKQVGETIYNREYKPLFDELEDAGIGERDMAKSPAMTSAYGQAAKNAKEEMARGIAEMLLDKALEEWNTNALDLINKITESEYALNGKGTLLETLTEEDSKKIQAYYKDKLTDPFVDAVNKAYPGIQAYREAMGVIFEALDNSGVWDGKIASAIETMLGNHNPSNRMSVRKLMSMTERDIDNELLSINEMMNNKTSFNVNLQHSVDAALLLMTLKKVMGNRGDKGIMTVHDAFYGDPMVAQEIMKYYNYYSIQAAMKYDFLSVAVKELERVKGLVEDPAVIDSAIEKANAIIKKATQTETPEGMNIQELFEAKKKFLSELSDVRVLGNAEVDVGVVTEADVKEGMTAEETVKPTTEKEVKEYNETEYATVKSVIQGMYRAKNSKELVESLKKLMTKLQVPETHTKLYEKVVRALEDPTMTFSKGTRYEAFSKKVRVDAAEKSRRVDVRSGEAHTVESLIETLAHEIDHAYQLDYIDNNKNATDVRYMQRLVDKIMNEDNRAWRENLSEKAADRVDYVKSVDTADKIPELVAILMSEPDVAVEIQKYLAGSQMMRMLEAFIAKVQEYVNKLLQTSPEKVEAILEKGMNSDISVKNINAALMSLDHNARANSLTMTAKKKPVRTLGMAEPKDVNEHMFMAPYNYVNDVIAAQNSRMSDWMIIWGDAMLEHMGPPVAKWHRYMKISHKLYREGIEMIRHGFYDSDFAKRMHETLGLAGDSKQVLMNKVHTLATDYQQESKQHLIDMAEMHRQIKNTYSKKEQVVLSQLFADTAIANLGAMPELRDRVLNGTVTLEAAMEELRVKGKEELDDLANYYMTGKTETGLVNMTFVQDKSAQAKMYVTLKAMSLIDGSHKMLVEMKPELRKWMMSIALLNRDLNEEINERGYGYDGQRHSESSTYKNDYDGSMSKDIHTKVMETKLVTLADMRKTENSEEYEWIVLKAPTKDTMGVIGRENLASGYTTGVGLELNRYVNGVIVSSEQSELINVEIGTMDEEDQLKWLNKNGMVRDGNRYRVLIDKKTKIEKMGLIEDAAESLYRTFIHNKDLLASEAVRRTLLENGTRRITSLKGMDALEEILKRNYKEGLFGLRTEVDPFLNIDYKSAEMEDIATFDNLRKKYPMIAQHYKTPTGLTTYNGFNGKVQLVQRGVYEELLGHKNASIFGGTDKREAARWENLYKKIVVLAKQKMIVMNPLKLLNDTVSNVGVLGMLDMSPAAIYDGMKKGWSAYHEYSAERTKLVHMQMEARIADEGKARDWAIKKLQAQEEKMKTLEFYKAHEYGFVQSYGTELVVKEFDTISGIQRDIDDAVDKYTHTANGEPNKLFGAIKWFMNAGVNVDELMYKAGNNAKLKGTTVGEELVSASERLKNKKNDKESVAAYVSELIGAPSSSAAAYGGAYMVLSDALSKYTLAKHLMTQVNPKSGERGSRRLYTEEEAYMKANETFIDYRKNIPSEVKALSDYGVLMFPAYWMRVQKVIGGLLKYHPVSTLLSYGVETAMGVESLNVVNQAAPIKAAQYGGLVHAPWEIVTPEAVAGGIFISL